MPNNNPDHNFGLPFELPDYEDIEFILDQMSDEENILRAEYNVEKIRIAEIQRARQVLQNSNVPKNSETFIKRDAKITIQEKELAEKYRKVREAAQVKPVAPKAKPRAPQYRNSTEQSKSIVTPRRQKEIARQPNNEYNNVAGWLLAAGASAALLWGGYLGLSNLSKEEDYHSLNFDQVIYTHKCMITATLERDCKNPEDKIEFNKSWDVFIKEYQSKGKINDIEYINLIFATNTKDEFSSNRWWHNAKKAQDEYKTKLRNSHSNLNHVEFDNSFRELTTFIEPYLEKSHRSYMVKNNHTDESWEQMRKERLKEDLENGEREIIIKQFGVFEEDFVRWNSPYARNKK